MPMMFVFLSATALMVVVMTTSASAAPIGDGMCANVTIPATTFEASVLESFQLTKSMFLFSPTNLSTKTPQGSQPCSTASYFARYDGGNDFCMSAPYTMSDTPNGCIWGSSMTSGFVSWTFTFFIMCDPNAPADGQVVPPPSWITIDFTPQGRGGQFTYSGTFHSRAVCGATPSSTSTTARSYHHHDTTVKSPLFRIAKKDE